MKYYIITPQLAGELGITQLRLGNGSDGYLVNTADLSDTLLQTRADDIREVDVKTAKVFASNNKRV